MFEQTKVTVKLSESLLNKPKNAVKNQTIALRMDIKMFNGIIYLMNYY